MIFYVSDGVTPFAFDVPSGECSFQGAGAKLCDCYELSVAFCKDDVEHACAKFMKSQRLLTTATKGPQAHSC